MTCCSECLGDGEDESCAECPERLLAEVTQARAERDFKRDALTARARGDWEAERRALDGLILLERGRLGETPPTIESKEIQCQDVPAAPTPAPTSAPPPCAR